MMRAGGRRPGLPLVAGLLSFVLLSYVLAVSGIQLKTGVSSSKNIKAPNTMSLVLFDNTSADHAVCNDGSPAGFWFRPGNTSKWSIHLAGKTFFLSHYNL